MLLYYISIGVDKMKCSGLVSILRQGHLVIPLFVLQNYKRFELTLEEFIFLMYLYNLGDNIVFNPLKFAKDLNIDNALVMGYIEKLTDKKLIRVEVVKNDKGLMEEVVLLDDFYNKLSLMTMDEVNQSSGHDNSNIFEIVEREFGRTLSPIEYEIIKAWLDGGMSEELIKEAIKEATFNGVSNLRYIDKILYEWGKQGIKTVGDVEKNRRNRKSNKNDNDASDVDLDIVEWNWFDEDE